MAQLVPGGLDDPQLAVGARRGRQRPGIGHVDDRVVGSVQHQQWSPLHATSGGFAVDLGEFATPVGERRGEAGSGDHPQAAGVYGNPAGLPCELSQGSWRRERRDRPDPEVRCRHRDRNRAALGHAHDPHSLDCSSLEQLTDRGADVCGPPARGEVAATGAGPPEVERQRDTARLARDPIGKLGEGGRRGQGPARSGGEPMTEHDTARPSWSGGPGKVRRKARAVGALEGRVQTASILDAMGVPALKEWAVIVRALLAGEQVLDVRKGGLREDGHHFDVQAGRCWLYPTIEHQQPQLLKPAYQRWVADTIAAAPAERAIRVEGWAEIMGAITITEPDDLAKIDGKLIWTSDYAASRLKWKRRDALWVLALRAHRLVEPIVVPWREGYGGCTSWVDLDGLPDDPGSVASEPALSDESFSARLALVEGDLGRKFEIPSTQA